MSRQGLRSFLTIREENEGMFTIWHGKMQKVTENEWGKQFEELDYQTLFPMKTQ